MTPARLWPATPRAGVPSTVMVTKVGGAGLIGSSRNGSSRAVIVSGHGLEVGRERSPSGRVRCSVYARGTAQHQVQNEFGGGKAEADASPLMPGRIPEPRHPRVLADHRQVIRHEWPEPTVAAHHGSVGEKRKQTNSLGCYLTQHVDPQPRVEADQLAGRANQHGAGSRGLDHAGGLQRAVVGSDRTYIV